MRVISKQALKAFWLRYPDAKQSLLAWFREAEAANWDQPAKVKAQFRNCSVLKNNRVVFNVKGNTYRLVVKINYDHRVIYIRFVGSHAEYDAIDVNEV